MDYTAPENIALLKKLETRAAAMTEKELEAELYATPEHLHKLVKDIESGKTARFMMDGNINKFITDVKTGEYDNI